MSQAWSAVSAHQSADNSGVHYFRPELEQAARSPLFPARFRPAWLRHPQPTGIGQSLVIPVPAALRVAAPDAPPGRLSARRGLFEDYPDNLAEHPEKKTAQ